MKNRPKATRMTTIARTCTAALCAAALSLAAASIALAQPVEPLNGEDPSFTARLSYDEATYNAKAHKPKVLITAGGEEHEATAEECTIAYNGNGKNAGTYSVTVEGKGALTGTVDLSFTVKPAPLTDAGTKLKYTSKVYTGKSYKPSVTEKRKLSGTVFTLKKNRDYTVAYDANCTKAGKHRVKIKGKGNYTGTITTTYRIERRPIAKLKGSLSKTYYNPNGSERKPQVTVKGTIGGKKVTLKKNRDYTVTYKNNVRAGLATATVKGTGNFKGTIKLSFTIGDPASASLYQRIANQSSSTRYIIAVSCSKHRVGIYTGKKGAWKQIKFWKCTNGAPSTPSRKGTFTVGSRGTAFGHGYTCWYWTQWSGNYLFHSVLYNPGSKSSMQDGRLGIAASHGCIRLAIGNAYWIYRNIPRGTKVIVY